MKLENTSRQMKNVTPKCMGCNDSIAKREIYSSKQAHLKRSEMNNLALYLKRLEELNPNSEDKGSNEDESRDNEIEKKIEKQQNSCFSFERINKVDKCFPRLTKEKK